MTIPEPRFSHFFAVRCLLGVLFQLSIPELTAAAYTTCSPTLCALFGQELLLCLPCDSQPCCATSLCHTCPAPTPTVLTEILCSACIYFVSFVVRKGGWKPQLWKKQVWSALTRFFWLSFLFSSMCVYTQSTALSFFPKPGSNYTLSLCCSLSPSTTNPNVVINASLLQVLYLLVSFSTQPVCASFKSHQAAADVTLVT